MLLLCFLFSTQAVGEVAASQLQLHHNTLCCLLLRIEVFKSCGRYFLQQILKWHFARILQASLRIRSMFSKMTFLRNRCFYAYIPIVWFCLSDPGHEVWCLDPLTGNTGPKWRSMTLSLPGLTSPHPSLPRCVYLQVWVCPKDNKRSRNDLNTFTWSKRQN